MMTPNPLFAPRTGRLVSITSTKNSTFVPGGDNIRDLLGPPTIQIRHLRPVTVPRSVKPEIHPGEERTIPDWQVASKAQAILVEGRTDDGREITRAYQPREHVELREPQIFMNDSDERRMRAWLTGEDDEAWT